MSAKSVILVHGAWADGSSWAKVILGLRRRGFAVTAIQMPLIGFNEDVASLRRALAAAEAPVVLVAHSYGGAVITEAGLDEKVSALVYIAAFAPDAGESAASLGLTVEPPPLSTELRPDEAGFLTLTEAGVREDFAQDLSDNEKAVLYSAQAPTAVASLAGVITKPAWRYRPTWYLLASEDRALQPKLQKIMAGRMCAKTREVAASHVAMISQPKLATRLIAEAAVTSTDPSARLREPVA